MVIPVFFLVFGANFISPKYKLTGFQIFGIFIQLFYDFGYYSFAVSLWLKQYSFRMDGRRRRSRRRGSRLVLGESSSAKSVAISSRIFCSFRYRLSSKGYIFRWIRASLKKARLFGGKVAQSTSKIILEEVSEDSVSYAPKETAKKLPQAPN